MSFEDEAGFKLGFRLKGFRVSRRGVLPRKR
jgi:hypothetical protein